MYAAIEVMIRQHFPDHCACLGPEEITLAIRDAVHRGREFAFKDTQLPAYVALEFAFGDGFSTSPAFSWAQEILRDQSVPSDARMQELRSSAIFYLADLAEAAETVAPQDAACQS